MNRCAITFENIADYHDGRLNAEMAGQVRDHLEAGCAQCRQNLGWLQHAKDTMQEAQSVRMPASLKERAYALFAERFRAPIRRSWLARLQFDGRSSTPALAGARGSQAESFQLVYSTEAHDIELFQEPQEQGNWYIIGQVMPKEGDATLVPQEVVLAGSDQSRRTFMVENGEFHLSAIPVGIYDVTLRLDEEDILLSNVAIGQQTAA